MTRRALIIGNPGEAGRQGYCQGVRRDLDNYFQFLCSPVGGFWRESEITVRWQPKKSTIRDDLLLLELADYSLTIFCGHGHYSASTGSTIIEMKPGVSFDSDVLRAGAPKHTLILDCCREVADTHVIVLDEMAKAATMKSEINPSECRRYYDAEIDRCGKGLVVMFGCSIDERAGDSASRGGYYSSSLINSAEVWGRETYVDTTAKYRSISVVQAHEMAIPRVRQISGRRQTPDLEKPRSDRHFPFAIIA